MFMEAGTMVSMAMDGMQDIGMADGMQVTGVVFVPGDSIIGITHSGVTAATGGTTLTGAGVMATTILGSTTVMDGDLAVITTRGIKTTTDTPLLQIADVQIKIDLFLVVDQTARIEAHGNNQA